MAVRNNNSFEASFENLSATVKQAKKTIVADVKQQLTGETPGQKVANVGFVDQLGLKQVKPEDKKVADQKQEHLLNETRQNLARITSEVEQARQRRIKAEQDRLKVEQEKKQQKKVVEQKKTEDPAWLKALRGKTGSQEGPKNVSG